MSIRDLENWMWADACALLERAERLHRQFFQLGPIRTNQPVWTPPADIFETDEEICIAVALPGIPADRIEIRLEPGLLVVSGERPIPHAMRRASIRRLEIPYGRFERRIELPLGPLRMGRQQLQDGCVQLYLKKR
ncbi:MAG: Hsp20/alpha crystallin family protein [Pseudomonadota bacterium]